MKYAADKFGGLVIDSDSIPQNTGEFISDLDLILNNNRDKKIIWMTLSIEFSRYIQHLTERGFLFYTCNSSNITLFRKTSADTNSPTPANHTLATGAIIIKDNQILVIKNRLSNNYKLPGGSIDDNETIAEALEREVREETGVIARLLSVSGLSHITNSQFGESNLYLFCMAEAKTTQINIIDTQEIEDAKWMDLDEFFESDRISIFLKNSIPEALNRIGLHHTIVDPQYKHEMYL